MLIFFAAVFVEPVVLLQPVRARAAARATTPSFTETFIAYSFVWQNLFSLAYLSTSGERTFLGIAAPSGGLWCKSDVRGMGISCSVLIHRRPRWDLLLPAE